MAVAAEHLVTSDQAKDLMPVIARRLQDGKTHWRPLHARQDYWMMLYKMQDVIQQMKPVGHRRFVSNEPHCVTPDTRVLTADLQWVAAKDLEVDQELFAFEDEPVSKLGSNPRGLRARHHRHATVTHTEIKTAPVYKITLADGRTVRATGEHKWLARVANVRGQITWLSTEDMAKHYDRRGTKYPGNHGANAGRMWLSQYFQPWDAGDDDRDTGYLAGAFDADGTVYRKTTSNHFPMIEFTQYDNACLESVAAALTRKGFSYNVSIEKTPKGNAPIHRLYLNGGRSELMRFLGQIRPPRLLARFAAMAQDDVELRAMGDAEIVSVVPDGETDIVALTSSSGTYHTEYGASHNTAVDLAVSILTRNDAFWRIPLFEVADENADERRLIGKIERALQGIIYDIDDQLSQRLLMRFWKQVAYSALLRGYIWGKVHVTNEALKYRETPLIAQIYDPRMVYPNVDSMGLNYVIIESVTNLGELVNMYPEQFGDREHSQNYNPNSTCIKVEYWSNDRGERKGITCVMAYEAPVENVGLWTADPVTVAGTGQYIIPPYYHGLSPEALPVIGVPVNGLNLQAVPQLGQLLTERMAERQQIMGSASALSWWTGPNAYIADTGRSILAAVEEHVPQYNELIATIMHHLALTAYGTLVFTSPTGEQPRFKTGIESHIALTPDERVEHLELSPINSDAYQMVKILGDEKEKGMLANILTASGSAPNTGVLFQQMANAALNALEPYQDGMEEFGQRCATSILAQFKAASSVLKPFEVMAPSSAGASKRQSFWVVEFDAKELNKKRRYRPRPVFKPALPDDISTRINAARLALDPRRPILSLTTVLEHILQIEDPTDEIDRIWEDIANTDPVLVFEQVAGALERMGESELAERIKEKQFRTAFVEELQFRQASGTDIPSPGQAPGGGPGEMPSSAGGNTSTGPGAGQSTGAPAGLPTGDQTGV